MLIFFEVASKDYRGRVVGVLGERDRGKAHGYRSGTCLAHRAANRIPGPLTVHMAIRRQHHDRSLPHARS